MPDDNWNKHFLNIETKTKQRWKIREDGAPGRTQEIVHLGQQTLRKM